MLLVSLSSISGSFSCYFFVLSLLFFFFFFQAEDGIRDHCVTGVQTCALPISHGFRRARRCPTESREPREGAGWRIARARGQRPRRFSDGETPRPRTIRSAARSRRRPIPASIRARRRA